MLSRADKKLYVCTAQLSFKKIDSILNLFYNVFYHDKTALGKDTMKIFKGIGTNKILISEYDIEKEYLEFTSDMQNFNMCHNLIQAYVENEMLYCDILNFLENIKTTLVPYLNEQSYIKLRKFINAYLSNAQAFLSAIRKNIGSTSFKNITNDVHFKYKEYQFCYELRNTLQHQWYRIRVLIVDNDDIRILVEKNDLLKDTQIKPKMIDLLNSYPEQIDLLKEYHGFHIAQCEILRKAYFELYNDDAHKRLINFHKKNTDNQFLYIGDYQSSTNNEGKETIKLNFLHFDKNQILENIRFFKDIHS